MIPRILLISAVAPHPATTGGTQRTNLLHRALSAVGDVDLLLLRDEAEFAPPELAALRERFGLAAAVPRRRRGEWAPWSLVRPVAPGLVDRLAHHLGDAAAEYRPDPAIAAAARRLVASRGHHLIVARYLAAAAKSGAAKLAPTLVDVDDLDVEVVASRIDAPGHSALRRALDRRRLRRLETIVDPLLRRCAGHWIAKEADRATPALANATLLRNIPFRLDDATDEPPPAPSPAGSRVLLTVGTLTHRPNADGIDRFLAASWPRVRAAVPEARFRIVGHGLAPAQRQRWGAVAGADVVGFVDDLRGEYARCAATVCAVHEGGGTNIKIAESYRMGRAAVVAAHAMRGYEGILVDGESVRVGRGDDGLAEGCIALLGDPALRNRMADAGRAACARELSVASFVAAVGSLVRSVAARTFAG